MQSQFKIGDKVRVVAFVDCFGKLVNETLGLTRVALGMAYFRPVYDAGLPSERLGKPDKCAIAYFDKVAAEITLGCGCAGKCVGHNSYPLTTANRVQTVTSDTVKQFVFNDPATVRPEVYNVPDTPEYLTHWIWQHYVGIPGADLPPYDAEFTRMEDRIKRLHRESFVKGLHEGKDQSMPRTTTITSAMAVRPASQRQSSRTPRASRSLRHSAGECLGKWLQANGLPIRRRTT